jgi:hypothetical protein
MPGLVERVVSLFGEKAWGARGGAAIGFFLRLVGKWKVVWSFFLGAIRRYDIGSSDADMWDTLRF